MTYMNMTEYNNATSKHKHACSFSKKFHYPKKMKR